MPRVRLPNNWEPRDYQMNVWGALESGVKRVLAVWHRRSGKDDVCLHWAAMQAMKRVGNYWHMLPLQTQARRAIWDAVNPHTGMRRIDEAFPKEIRRTTRENEMMIVFTNGSTWQVLGSDNYDAYVGSPPVGIVFSEWALAKPAAWSYVRPILDENSGWCLFISTPRGKNFMFDMLQMAQDSDFWFSEVLPATETNVFDPEVLRRTRKELRQEYGDEHGENMFRQEYLCSFEASIMGAYYAGQMREAYDEGRICSVPIEKVLPVHTSWDLGMSDSTSIWFYQQAGKEIRIIDFYEANGYGLEHYAKVLKDKDYLYGDHFLPHDVEVRELGTGRSRIETLRDLGLDIQVVPRLGIEDGINAVRKLFPRMYFDKDRCKDGIEALKSYRRDWDDKRKVFKERPTHDWSSHASDSFRYLAVSMQEHSKADAAPLVYPSYGIA